MASTPRHCGLGHSVVQPLVYIHVMKSGGLSVDAMLKCRCSSAASPCALLREDGRLTGAVVNGTGVVAAFKRSVLYGSASCAGGAACTAAASPVGQKSADMVVEARSGAPPCRAQVLTTHAPLLSVFERPLWSRATTITVLREPVARVWSFYTYMRRKWPRGQQTALAEILRDRQLMSTAWKPTAPNTSLLHHPKAWAANAHNATDPGFIYRQLSNSMTLQFSRTDDSHDTPVAAPTMESLAAAMRSLDAVTVVGVTEDMAGFEAALAKHWPRTFGAGGCAIPSGSSSKNPTSSTKVLGSAPATLDEPTRRAIADANALDVQLYARARERAAKHTTRRGVTLS